MMFTSANQIQLVVQRVEIANGTAFVDLEEREGRVEATKKEIDKVRRQLLRRKPPSVTSNEKQRENALRYVILLCHRKRNV